MDTSVPIQVPMVATSPSFPDFYVFAWSLTNIAIIIAIIVLIFRYLKQKNDFRKQVGKGVESDRCSKGATRPCLLRMKTTC